MNSSTTETNSSTTSSISVADAIQAIRTLREQIPNASPITTAVSQRLRAAAGLHPDFVQAAVNAAGASDEVQAALKRTPESLQQDVNEDGPWSALEEEARALLRGIAAANLTRRHRVGITALQTYSITRALARQPEHAGLLPHVAKLASLAKRRGGQKAPQQQTPAPAPVGQQ